MMILSKVASDSVLPRKGSIMYGIMNNSTNSYKFANRYKIANKMVIVPLYRLDILPFLQIGRIILLLYTKGRKTGKTRIIPVEFRRYNEKILLFSARGKHGDWYKNVLTNPDDLKIKIGFRKYKPIVQTSTLDQKFEILKWYMESFPGAAKGLFGFQKKKDVISNELINQKANFIEIFQLEI